MKPLLIKWLNGDLETFCYDEKGYVIQYEYYIGGEYRQWRYILSYEGSNFEDSGDWPKYEVGRENAEGKEVWGYEYDWRGYNWEIRLFENGENNQRIASEVTLSTNEAVSVFMPM